MAGPRSRRTNALIGLSIVALVIIFAVYIFVSLHQARAGGGAGSPKEGTTLSVFITDQLAGWREPYT